MVASAAMVPLAPVRFSTVTGCLNASENCCASERAKLSTSPPGGRGESSRMGLAGYSCACVPQLNASNSETANEVRRDITGSRKIELLLRNVVLADEHAGALAVFLEERGELAHRHR